MSFKPAKPFAGLVVDLVLRQIQALRYGRAQAWLPGLLLGFSGILALIVFSGLLNGVDPGLSRSLMGAVFWLLLFTVLGFGAADFWQSDADDGTLDQDFVAAGGLYAPLICAAFVGQIFTLALPLSLIFALLWTLGLDASVPWGALAGLLVPILSLRLLASALALAAGSTFGAGSLFFLSLSAPFFFMAVAGRADLIWGLGFVFAPLCLLLLPFTLSISHRAR